jgi:hypothetical protein
VQGLKPGQEVMEAIELSQQSDFGAVGPDQEEANLGAMGLDGSDLLGPHQASRQETDELDPAILSQGYAKREAENPNQGEADKGNGITIMETPAPMKVIKMSTSINFIPGCRYSL